MIFIVEEARRKVSLSQIKKKKKKGTNKTILFIFYLWNPNIVTDNKKQNITKPKKKKKKKELNCFTCTKSMKCIPIFQTNNFNG